MNYLSQPWHRSGYIRPGADKIQLEIQSLSVRLDPKARRRPAAIAHPRDVTFPVKVYRIVTADARQEQNLHQL